MHNWKSYAEMAIALFVLLDPIGAVPIFVTLTAHHSPEERTRTINRAAATAFIVLIVALLAGNPLLSILGISIASFTVGGGVVLMMMAMAMLQGRASPVHRADEDLDEAAQRMAVAVVPLGVPVAAGPGAISAALIYGERAKNWTNTAMLVAIIALVVMCLWIALRLAAPTKRLLGTTGIHVVTRLLGLIAMAVAVEFIARGLSELLPGLRGAVG
ncbi:MAG TPA: MarC family protein [Candidatus Binataceae bacterium]|nr:MarC family protein [Candidatus Binataceae bacterium]